MTKTAIMSPSVAAQSASADPELEVARIRVNAAIERNRGRGFTYAASLIPSSVTEILLGELRRGGWNVQFVPDSRDGNYYQITPARK